MLILIFFILVPLSANNLVSYIADTKHLQKYYVYTNTVYNHLVSYMFNTNYPADSCSLKSIIYWQYHSPAISINIANTVRNNPVLYITDTNNTAHPCQQIN